jgi:calcium-dependent protein kinase
VAMPGLVYHSHGVEVDYEVNNKAALGEGGFGQVCKCTHIATKQERACKRIRKKDVKDKKAFEREVELQKAMDHPNICRLYDVYQDAKMYYLCLEMCRGGELFDRIIEAQHFGEDTVGLLAKQMLSGILYMHSNNFAHRDLKPENYLLARDLPIEQTHLKLIDFGMSRKFVPGQAMTTRVVTPYYVSPEVLAGKYDEKCDIWSLGVIFYILFCGSPPFFSQYDGRRGDEDIFKKVKTGKYTFEASEWKHVSGAARKFVSDTLVLDPKKRPTALGLLEHTWLIEHMPTFTPVPLSVTAIDSIKDFRQKNKLQKLALNMIAHFVEDEKVNELKQMFQTMDTDGNGTISIEEMKAGLESCGLTELTANLDETMRAIDNDGSGKIDYSEFIAATINKKTALSYDYVWQVFKQFDRTNTGTINKDDLTQILSGGHFSDYGHADGLSKADVEKTIDSYDTNHDGIIDFDEFMAAMMDGRTSLKA